ncbi:protein transport protein Sec24C isoform X1 [Schistocerca gregaria]|uniref:protein transport protein Sec24C isoform X1 n=1 Tax=Schistocerca gregaria TaxID=7010 RepID=UPI00211EA566|nr:protein transport protein Sec24C isoform X1 [Schistocerca gregaria]XP_049838127.1 protein transport protein Sec24C isoform X1 [Schistocerca gregaria]
MNPQYAAQHQPQYGVYGGGGNGIISPGAPPSWAQNGPPTGVGLVRPSTHNGGPGYPNPVVSNGPTPSHQGMMGFPPQNQQMQASPNQLAGEMAAMNLSGSQQKHGNENQVLPGAGGGPPGKPGFPSSPAQGLGTYATPGSQPAQQQRPSPGPSPSPYINGPGRGPTPVSSPQALNPSLQSSQLPPQGSPRPPPTQGQHSSLPPGHGGTAHPQTHPGMSYAHGSPLPAQTGPPGHPPTHGRQILAQTNHVQPRDTTGPQFNQMPPQGNAPPPLQSGSVPPQSSHLPPQGGPQAPQPRYGFTQSGHIPSQTGSVPPPQNATSPQGSPMPPHSGNVPPQGSPMPPHSGGMPPQGSPMPPHLGPPSHLSQGHSGPKPPGPPSGQIPPQYTQGSQFPTQAFQQGPHPPPPGPPMQGQIQPPLQGAQVPGGPYRGGPHMPPPQGSYPSSPQEGYLPQQAGYQPPQAGVGPGGSYPPNLPGQPQPQPVYSPQQQQQARRLDPDQMPSPVSSLPDQMPSPIQVMLDDQRNRSGVFITNQKGLVPPLVTTDFITQDQGNASPRYLRSSIYNVPVTAEMMKQTAVPFGLVISPLAQPAEGEYLPPVVDMGEIGPVRCARCKAYMCPYMQFVDGGRRFHCPFCKATTEVPAEYFQHLDHTGQRVDRFERPELTLGTYEVVATKEYCRNNTFPKPPAVIFVIDVSYNNIKSGLIHLLCREMKEILKLLPKEMGAERSSMKVGFITYNSTVHFYNVKGCLAQPQMMVVGDVQDMFVPLLDGFLCDPAESETVLDSLMEQIPEMFGDTRETETVLGPAIQAGLEALKAAECAGKLLVFNSSLPIAEAPGKLKNRDDRKLLGTEKEKTVLAPQITFYNNLGQECVGAGCSVDLFIFNNSYIDLATIGQVCRLSGGEIFKYTYFQADLDGERLIADIKHDVSRPVVFDAIMRVRTSTGVRATDFAGHFFMSNTTDMELASIDCDKAVAVEVKHDDKLTEEDGVYIQVAVLFTSCSGQRRLRIINLSLKTCSQLADLYRSCDLDTIINFFSKQVVVRLLESTPKSVKDGLVNRCAQMLACYRKNCASPSSAGQLILPECMKLLPLYINCVLKSDAVSGGSDMTLDDRSFAMQAVTIMDIPSSVVYFYPRLLPLHDIDVNSDDFPSPIRCSSDKIRDDGVYLLENGIYMFLWIGLNVNVEWVQNVFGVHSAAQIDIDRTSLQDIDNPLSTRIRSLVNAVRQQRHRCMRLTLVRQRDKLEMVFKHFLVEDRGLDGSASYVDFLCHMHREIRNLLS